MDGENFRESIFDVVEYLTNHPLSDRGRKLVLHYFNQSKESSSILKAFAAIERYFPESMPPDEERPASLNRLIEKLKEESDLWDSEESKGS